VIVEEKDKKLEDYIFDRHPIVIRNPSLPETSLNWEECLSHLAKCYKLNTTAHGVDLRYANELKAFCTSGEDVENVKKIVDVIQNLRPSESLNVHLYYGFLPGTPAAFHDDPNDVFYIQGLGKSKWYIDYNKELYEKELNQGDLIYIPKHCTHGVKTLEPRVGISISFIKNC